MATRETLNLKFMVLNAENLFLLLDEMPKRSLENYSEAEWQRLSRSIYEAKPLRKCQELASLIQKQSPDIILLSEVGGEESLKNFNTLFLNSTYSSALIEGNSDRNIHVGFLIRKGLPFYFDLISNKNRLINYLYPHERQSLDSQYPVRSIKSPEGHRFSRDCVELRLFKNSSEKPFMICLLTHLKSPLDPDRIDPGGRERRAAELKTLIEIYKEVETKFPDLPILVGGDFNGNASRHGTDEEFLPVYAQTELEDILEIAQFPANKRYTFFQFRNQGRTEGRQIDFAFLNKKARTLLDPNSAQVLRYKNELGIEVEAPENLDAKLRLPSDHNPLIFVLEKIQI